MEQITVGELIDQLKKFDKNLSVSVGAVGFSANDSWDVPLDLGKHTVDEFKGVVRINFSII